MYLVSLFRVFLLLGFWISLAPLAVAATLPVNIHVSDGVNTLDFSPDGIIAADNTFLVGPSTSTTPTWTLDWTIGGSPDEWTYHGRVIGAILSLTNTTDQPKNYDIWLTLFPSAISGLALAGANIHTSFTGPSGPDAMLSTNEVTHAPLRMDQIDGVDYVAFGDYLFSTHFPINSEYPSEMPVPGLPAPAVQSSLAMKYSFNLTPGDQITLRGGFYEVPAPEPASIAILATGLAILGVGRRLTSQRRRVPAR